MRDKRTPKDVCGEATLYRMFRASATQAKASWDILKFGVSTADTMLFRQNTCKTRNNTVEMSLAFHDVVRFERVTDLNLFKYAFNVIQNWKTDALQILFNSADCSYGRRT